MLHVIVGFITRGNSTSNSSFCPVVPATLLLHCDVIYI